MSASSSSPSSRDPSSDMLLSQELSALLRTSISNAAFAPPNAYAASLRCFVGKIIALDGIPCAGKTHLGRALCALFKENGVPAVFLEEKMNKRHLAAFYSAMKRGVTPNPHSTTLQLCAMMECVQIYQVATWYAGRGPGGGLPHVVVLDRPIWGNRVFEQLQVIKGNITQEEHEIYDSYIVKHGPFFFDYLVYLYASPEKAHHRVHHVRKHPEEQGMPVEYLRELERVYYAHVHRHLEQGDRALTVIANEDAYCSAESLLDTLRAFKAPPKVTGTAESIAGAGASEVARAFKALCEHYSS
jgi:deoxyadenosine/deoxycytidine kinase